MRYLQRLTEWFLVALFLADKRQAEISLEAAADHSFGLSGATLENTFGFKLELENLQAANANTDVSLSPPIKTSPDDQSQLIHYAIH